MNLDVAFHDVECHGYTADLELWRELARREDGPILDVGAGTGRVAGALAAEGQRVVALDRDAALLEELRARHPAVETVAADARSFALGERFGLVLVPMQTVQLLDDRAGFLAAARAHLAPGGLLAIAISEEMEDYGDSIAVLPDPDTGERDGWHFVSQPLGVTRASGRFRIQRLRTAIDPDGTRHVSDDVVELTDLSAESLEAEAAPYGLKPEARVHVAATDDHVSSTVVLLRG